jgi:hypothetical protein
MFCHAVFVFELTKCSQIDVRESHHMYAKMPHKLLYLLDPNRQKTPILAEKIFLEMSSHGLKSLKQKII